MLLSSWCFKQTEGVSSCLFIKKTMPSTVIRHFSYDPSASTLTITFLSGNVYRYQEVPPEVYQSLRIAGSKGRYFNFYIKDKYRFVHVSGSADE